MGEKILSDAAGTADGALKAHYDRITTKNNWEQQTYDERERFYLYSVGTYLQSAMLDSIALGYVADTSDSAVERSEAQNNLKELKAQIARVSSMAEKYQVKRLKSDYNRNLRTGIILSTKVEKVTYDANNRLVSNADAYRLIQQKLLDDTPKGQIYFSCGQRRFHAFGVSGTSDGKAGTGHHEIQQQGKPCGRTEKRGIFHPLRLSGFGDAAGYSNCQKRHTDGNKCDA